jgi:hypothetical protein
MTCVPTFAPASTWTPADSSGFQARCSEASVGRYGASVDRLERCNRRLEASKGALKLRFIDFNLQNVVLKLQDIVSNLQNARLRPQNSLLEPQNDLLSAPHTVRPIIQRSPNKEDSMARREFPREQAEGARTEQLGSAEANVRAAWDPERVQWASTVREGGL